VVSARKYRRWGLLPLILALAAATLILAPAGSAANPSANLDQCANGSDVATRTDGCNLLATDWVNGNLGSSKSAYVEGDSIPYRMTFGSLSLTGTHTVTIAWDTTKSFKHAIDQLTTYTRTVTSANACLGINGCGSGLFAPHLSAIPVDPHLGAGTPAVTAIGGNFTFYGATITGTSIYHLGAGNTECATVPFPTTDTATYLGNSDTTTCIRISFTAAVANPVLAWGGHIATRQDWGLSNSAVSITGSPYHTRLIDLDGSGGNQDRSLAAGAVFFPASITIIKDATPNGSTSFAFTGSPSPLTGFSLVDDGTVANTRVFSNILAEATYTVNETPIPTDWAFDSISCAVTSPNGGSTSTSTTTVNIVLKEGENWTCTYANHFNARPGISIVKSATESTFTAAGAVLHYSYVVTNTGNETLTGVTVSDNNIDTPPGVSCPATTLAVGGSMTCTAQHAVTQGEVDGGCSVTNTASVSTTQGASDSDSLTITGSCSPGISIDKSSTTTVITAAGQVVPYSYVVTNTGSVTLTGITVTDDKVASVSCPATTLAVGASMTCTGSHTVTAAEFAAGGNLTNLATADSDQTGPVTDTVSIPITPPTLVGQITPTGTTCGQFNAGTSATLSQLNYAIKAGKLSAVNPGVFFYWIKVTATAGANTFTVNQSQSDTFPRFFDQASGTAVYNSGCNKVSVQNITTSSAGVTTVTFTAPTAGTYIIGIKYSSKSVEGFGAPAGDVIYTFATGGVSGSSQNITLKHP
jgi:uncharacterized repeat protein (TIGR01451 family)